MGMEWDGGGDSRRCHSEEASGDVESMPPPSSVVAVSPSCRERNTPVVAMDECSRGVGLSLLLFLRLRNRGIDEAVDAPSIREPSACVEISRSSASSFEETSRGDSKYPRSWASTDRTPCTRVPLHPEEIRSVDGIHQVELRDAGVSRELRFHVLQFDAVDPEVRNDRVVRRHHSRMANARSGGV